MDSEDIQGCVSCICVVIIIICIGWWLFSGDFGRYLEIQFGYGVTSELILLFIYLIVVKE